MNNSTATRFLFAAALLAACAFGPAPALAEEPYKETLSQLKKEVAPSRYPLTTWYMRKNKTPVEGAIGESFDESKWGKTRLGTLWSGAGNSVWFRQHFTVPEEVEGVPVAGSKVILHINGQGSGSLFLDGQQITGFSNGVEAMVTDSATPERTHIIVVELKPGESNQVGMLSDAWLSFSALEKAKDRTEAYIAQVSSMERMLDFVPNERAKWTALMNESAANVDLAARNEGRDGDYLASLDAASQTLAPFGKIAKKYTMHLVGYSHIDLAWLWDYAEGKRVIRDTVNTVTKLMDEYPDFTYTQTQAQAEKWMEEENPEVFAKIQKWFKTGRFELTGGTWSEHDSNLPSGESFVRQFLYGKRYFKEKFGKDIIVAWTPDSFGYNWNMPQILKKSGMIGFLTQKIRWNDTVPFPHHVFWWEGPDGTRLLTYFPVGGYGESVNPVEMVNQLKTLHDERGLDENFVIFGIGDHGGGLTRGHLERAEMVRNDPSYPKVEFTTAEKYFKHLHELAKTKDFPVWDDELYLQYHRGTYTTQVKTKRNNRRGEILMEEAEKFSEIARPMGMEWPKDELMEGWEVLLLNQMHDILPGSGINKVYQDTEKDYARMFEKGKAAMYRAIDLIGGKADTAGEGEPVLLFNPLTWSRDDVVKIPLAALPENPGILDPQGRPVPVQEVEAVKGAMLMFVAKNLPPMGYAVWRAVANGERPPAASALKADDNSLESDAFALRLNPDTGFISSLADKRAGRELIAPGSEGGAVLMMYDDNPKEYDAWNIGLKDRLDLTMVAPPELVENGPVRATIRTTFKIKASTFDQYLSVYPETGLVEGRVDVNWLAKHVMAKLAFNLNLKAGDVWYEIPYAAIPRAAVPKTDFEKAEWEVSGHKWVDYSGKDGGYGVSLLNESKYGFDVKEENMLRMSLLRSPGSPDPSADVGRQRIEYALYPHEGDWRQAATPRRGAEFNYPVLWDIAEKHGGELPPVKSWYSAGPDNVLLTVVKKAEDSDNTILRLYEAAGLDSTAEIKLPAVPRGVVETNLMEEEIGPVDFVGDTIAVPMGHFEIKTLKVVW